MIYITKSPMSPASVGGVIKRACHAGEDLNKSNLLYKRTNLTMNSVNKTLYIPLYGKASISKKGIILSDKKAEAIWAQAGFKLKGKSKSKWLAYYMAMRSAVFDSWLRQLLETNPDSVVVHIGCGLDSRTERVGLKSESWYDIDFPQVISERKRYYNESDTYHMLGVDVRKLSWVNQLPSGKKAIVVMEGVSMYIERVDLLSLMKRLTEHFCEVNILMDCYTELAAELSKYKNPINDVGVTQVYGIGSPSVLTEGTGLMFIREHEMTPDFMIEQLSKREKFIFKHLYGGRIANRMYRLYEYKSCNEIMSAGSTETYD